MTQSTAILPLEINVSDDLQRSLAEVAKLRKDVGTLIQDVGGEFDQHWNELRDSAKQLDKRQTQLEAQEIKVTDLAERIQETAGQHQERQAALEQEQAKSAELSRELETVSQQNDQERAKLETTICDLEAQLKETQDELTQTRQQLQQVQTVVADEASSRAESAEALSENERLSSELHLCHERIAVMNQSLDQQLSELNDLRQSRQHDLNSVSQEPPLAPIEPMAVERSPASADELKSQASAGELSAEKNTSSDPIVDSVLAEFSSLEG